MPERIQLPADTSVPAAVAKTRTVVSEMRPQFEKRILEERHPVTHTHVIDDWFVLLDVDLKESGIFFFTCLGLLCTADTCSMKCLLTFAAGLQDTLTE